MTKKLRTVLVPITLLTDVALAFTTDKKSDIRKAWKAVVEAITGDDEPAELRKPRIVIHDDHEMKSFLSGVEYTIEATREEQMGIWDRWHNHYGVEWKENNSGFLPTVGHFGDMPVCISIMTAVVGGRKVLFYHPTSLVVHHDIIREWLQHHLPGVPNTDATNASHAFPQLTKEHISRADAIDAAIRNAKKG